MLCTPLGWSCDIGYGGGGGIDGGTKGGDGGETPQTLHVYGMVSAHDVSNQWGYDWECHRTHSSPLGYPPTHMCVLPPSVRASPPNSVPSVQSHSDETDERRKPSHVC